MNPTITEVRETTKEKILELFTHVAFGTGTFPGDSGQTALDNETVTKARFEYSELTNSVIVSAFIPANEQNSTTIKEAGAKDGSTGTLQSGKALTEFDKTSTKEFWVDNEVELVLTQS